MQCSANMLTIYSYQFENDINSFGFNYTGSSAGAGSGEFHVYRGIRRREYARQKVIEEKGKHVQVLISSFYIILIIIIFL